MMTQSFSWWVIHYLDYPIRRYYDGKIFVRGMKNAARYPTKEAAERKLLFLRKFYDQDLQITKHGNLA